MDALVHEAAAVLGPRPAPRGLLVVGAVAVPADVDGTVGEPPEATPLQGPAGLLHGHVEAVLVAGAHLHTGRVGASNDLVGVGHGHGQGLLDDDVDAAVDEVEGDPGVLAALGGHGCELDLGVLGQHLPVVGVAADGAVALEAVLGQERLHALGQHVADGHEVEAVALDGGDVVGGDAAAADDGALHATAPRCCRGSQHPSWRSWCRTRPGRSPGPSRSPRSCDRRPRARGRRRPRHPG